MQHKTLVVAGSVLLVASAFGQGQGDIHRPEFVTLVRHSVTPPLRTMISGKAAPGLNREIRRVRVQPGGPAGPKLDRDPLLQETSSPTSSALTPAPLFSFEGTSDQDNEETLGYRVVPPDPEGDVGPNYYVQMNNLVLEIWDKQGNVVLGPIPNNRLWSAFGSGTPCHDNNDGDPIVLYDRGADRWLLSQFAITTAGHQCIAVSATPDPTGVYYLYDYQITSNSYFHDYPKFGIWPDGYYMTAHEFLNLPGFGTLFNSTIAVAFDRSKLLQGASNAPGIKFNVSPTLSEIYYGLLPSHWGGGPPPPPGSPATLGMAFDDQTWGTGTNPDGYRLWEIVPNWMNLSASTLQSLGQVDTADFDSNLCQFGPCVPQPAPGELLDSLSQVTMYKLMYRNLNGTDALVGNHTVDVGGDRAGIRWFELRKTGGNWGLYQTGTYGPSDGVHRWAGSIAMDELGNIALSYSASSTADFPSIRYTSRASSDPLGELPGGEETLQQGGGSQTSSYSRWGDYSTISVDPADDCTFWVTNEYYAATGPFDFRTRIGAFSLPGCSGGSTPPTLPAAPTNLTANVGSTGGRTKQWFVNLSWTDNSDNETGFTITRGAQTGSGRNRPCTPSGSPIANLEANATSYTDNDVQSSTRYCYQVVAYNGAGESAPSNVATAKIGK